MTFTPPRNSLIALAFSLFLIPNISIAQNAQKFDLVCNFTIKKDVTGKIGSSNAKLHLKVDTRGGMYCFFVTYKETNCSSIFKFNESKGSINQNEYLFYDNFDGEKRSYMSVNRYTGALEWQSSQREAVGTCTRRPFSGFPSNKF